MSAPFDYQQLFESIPGLYLILQPDLKIIAVSDAYLAATMTERNQIIGRSIFEVFPDNPDDPHATGVRNLTASLDRVLRTRAPDTMAIQKYDVRRPAALGNDFEERYWSPLNSPVLDTDGNVLYIIHRAEDVTEFMHLKMQGREKEKETQGLRTRIEHMEAEIYQRAQELQVTNQALQESEARLQQLNAGLEDQIRQRTYELEAEVRERERVQEALRETQKLEALGRMTGSIAHDFNNLLTVIVGNADLVGENLASPEDQTMIKSIQYAAARGARLTRQLLAFTRRQALRPEIIDLASRKSDMAEFFSRSLRGDIRMAVKFSQDIGLIECDLSELELALLNLCINARDAMPNGGLVRIEGHNVTLPNEDPATYSLSGDFVALTVYDTGNGIDPETLSRVFEPFFTTKEVGKGSGLGLAQVYGFAGQSGGIACIKSEVGTGTAVTLYLPRTSDEVAATVIRPSSSTRTIGQGTILLVEDDEEVARIAIKLLQLIGYNSQWIQDAQTALSLLLGGQRFDLVFSDIVMPGGMSGLELARKIRRHFPDQPLLLASGYNSAAAEVIKEGFPLIAKPYRADSLSDAIQKSLNTTQALLNSA